MGLYANSQPQYYDYFGVQGEAVETARLSPTVEQGIHRVVSAHEILIYMQNPKGGPLHLIGRAQRLSARRDFGTELVYEIGSMKPQEAVPLRYEGTIDLERYFVRLDDLKGALGQINIPFSLSHEGKILEHSTFGFTITVKDKYTGETIREYQNCIVRSCDEEIRAGAIVGETMSLYYSECLDHAEVVERKMANTTGDGQAAGGTGK